MDRNPALTLQKLGLAAADDVAGKGAVEDVDVHSGIDAYDRPTYHFYFLLDDARMSQNNGLLLARLSQRLSGELTALGDEHFALIHLLNKQDWSKHLNARSG